MEKQKQQYYGQHAYNSQQLSQQRLANQPSPSRSLQRTLGNSQGEVPQDLFFQLPPKEMRKLEHKTIPDWMDNERYGAVNHRCLKPTSFAKNTSIFLLMEGGGWAIMIFVAAGCLLTFLLIFFGISWKEGVESIPYLISFVAVPALICLAGRILREFYLDHGIGSPWELNRQTGMVSTFTYDEENPEQEPTVQSVPFYEMQPYIINSADRFGFKHLLTLHHKYSDFKVQVGDLIGDTSLIDYCDDLWDFIQDYMDISKPLPDIPLLEKYRSQDPVTAEYDKQTARNPRYWIDISDQDWKQQKDLYLYPRQARIEQRKKLATSLAV